MNEKYWAVVPAAGIGSRMDSEIPKQYLKIAEKTVLEHTLNCFIQHPKISGIVVVISTEDKAWNDLNIIADKTLITARGGAERCDSVRSGLQSLEKIADQKDWVLVHDAARPCLRPEDIDKLINEASDHHVGGLLASPVRDTMKRGVNKKSAQIVYETVERINLWHALTPQMFHLSDLKFALENAQLKNYVVTDEAQAMELIGMMPLLIEGHTDNIKVTRPQDLELVARYLEKNSE
ncbi:MAG: 2-C-methyl-D-erythritol 4-phosphate cytidylyltransferase [Gammaproteobacteria bacterium]